MSGVRVVVPVGMLDLARHVGIERANNAFARNLKNWGDREFTQSEQMAHHIRGARCERTVEHYTDLDWKPSIGVLGGPDVGDKVQVRSTKYASGGLLYRPGFDNPEQPFVLVWDRGTDLFVIKGWLWGRECSEWWRDNDPDRPYVYVPPPYRHIDTLLPALAEITRRASTKTIAPSSTTAPAP